MHPGIWVGYLFGRGRAIREVAENRNALGTGVALVLLTAIARNYDQTFIGERPFLWLFGSLLFSIGSGTWLYLMVYGCFVRRAAADADGRKPALWSGWWGFMGLFWMTSPVAWLYAIPVERFCDSLTATKANLCLLGLVSFWRVLLMTRVIQHLTRGRFPAVLAWVLFAAALEVLAVIFFGGTFARAIMSSMGGMRNSPEENLMIRTLSTVFTVAFWVTPVAFVFAVGLLRRESCEPLPLPANRSWSGRGLLLAALFWVGLAVYPKSN